MNKHCEHSGVKLDKSEMSLEEKLAIAIEALKFYANKLQHLDEYSDADGNLFLTDAPAKEALAKIATLGGAEEGKK